VHQLRRYRRARFTAFNSATTTSTKDQADIDAWWDQGLSARVDNGSIFQSSEEALRSIVQPIPPSKSELFVIPAVVTATIREEFQRSIRILAGAKPSRSTLFIRRVIVSSQCRDLSAFWATFR